MSVYPYGACVRGLREGFQDFPGGSDGKESACNAGDLGSIPGLGRSPGEGDGYPLQYSCLKNSMDRGAQGLRGHKELAMTDPLSLSQVSKEKGYEYRWEQHTQALHEDALTACMPETVPPGLC